VILIRRSADRRPMRQAALIAANLPAMQEAAAALLNAVSGTGVPEPDTAGASPFE
jgi:hypothetical protein